MSFIEKISVDLSNKLGERLNKTDDEKAVLNYGLFMLLHTTIAIIITFMVGVITNTLLEIMIISITASLLKRYSGGVHSSTPFRCIITGIILTLFLSNVCKYSVEHIDNFLMFILVILTITIVYYIINIKCPVPSKNKPFKNEATRNKIRKKAFKLITLYTIIIVILYIIYNITYSYINKIMIISMLLGMLLQIFSMINVGHKIIMKLERVYDILRVV